MLLLCLSGLYLGFVALLCGEAMTVQGPGRRTDVQQAQSRLFSIVCNVGTYTHGFHSTKHAININLQARMKSARETKEWKRE